MKRILLFSVLSLASTSIIAQTQIGNADMEIWEDVGNSTESPENWSGIKEASGNGLFISFAPKAITQSTDTHTGSGFSAQLEAKDALGNTANGTMTCGRLNVGSTDPANADNYAWSETSDAAFSEACTDAPDSIVWWTKFTAGNALDSARMKATIHDNYDYQDPEDAGSLPHIVASAVRNYVPTGGWVRMSAPFNYTGPASVPEYILVTFTTNKTPGGGTIGDIVLIDDVELIYNPNSVEELTSYMNLFINNESNMIVTKSSKPFSGTYSAFNMAGQMVQSGDLVEQISFEQSSGFYIFNVEANGSSHQFKIYKK